MLELLNGADAEVGPPLMIVVLVFILPLLAVLPGSAVSAPAAPEVTIGGA